jgi:flagellar biosynthesis protein FliR
MEVTSWWTFLFVLVRITSFFLTVPIFSGRQIPATYKIGFSVMLSLLCVGIVDQPMQSTTQGTLVLLLLKEVMVGVALGLVASILFYSVQLAGSLIDFQVGMAMASLFDPTSGTNTQLTGSFKNILAILVLLSTNGHHLLIQGILASFDWIGFQSFVPAILDGRLSTFLLDCIQQMFMIGLMMALPIMGTLFIVDVASGIMAKTVPQMNIFAVFVPAKFLIHFFVYIFILPSFFYLLKLLFETMYSSMSSILNILGG